MIPDRTSVRLTRRSVVLAGIASLSGCSGLGNLVGGFEFPDGDPSDDQKQMTRTFVDRVHGGKYEASTGPFTDELTEELPPDQIESIWTEQLGDLGEYEEIEQWGLESVDEGDAVFARVSCANGRYALQLTFVENQVGGVFIRNVEQSG